MLFAIFERMPDINLNILKWRKPWGTFNEERLRLIFNDDENNLLHLSAEQGVTICHILSELPNRVENVPDPLYSPESCPTPEIAELVHSIDQLWKNYAAKSPILPLSHLCRKVIRRTLCPVRGHKVDKLPLPYILKKFISYNEIAETVYDMILDHNKLHGME